MSQEQRVQWTMWANCTLNIHPRSEIKTLNSSSHASMEVNVNIWMYTQNACMYSSMPQKPFNHEIGTKRLKSYKSHYALAISIKCISLKCRFGTGLLLLINNNIVINSIEFLVLWNDRMKLLCNISLIHFALLNIPLYGIHSDMFQFITKNHNNFSICDFQPYIGNKSYWNHVDMLLYYILMFIPNFNMHTNQPNYSLFAV